MAEKAKRIAALCCVAIALAGGVAVISVVVSDSAIAGTGDK
jgi:hypothetical protein